MKTNIHRKCNYFHRDSFIKIKPSEMKKKSKSEMSKKNCIDHSSVTVASGFFDSRNKSLVQSANPNKERPFGVSEGPKTPTKWLNRFALYKRCTIRVSIMQISSLGDVTLRHKSRYVVINGQLFVTYGRKQLQTSSGKDHYSADDTANKNSPKSGAPVLKLFLKEVQINTSFFPMSEACIKLFYYFER